MPNKNTLPLHTHPRLGAHSTRLLLIALIIAVGLAACHREQDDKNDKTAKLEIQLEDDPRLGGNDAPIGLVVFSDYQCPHCQHFHTEVLPQLKTAYIDKNIVQYIYKDFPLKTHRMAFSASLAANCAGEQDSYWSMQDALFANQTRLSLDLLHTLAKRLDLDEEAFSGCIKQAEQIKEVYSDLQYGLDLGVRSTPTFFLGHLHNGVLIVERMADGAPAFAVLQQEIEALRH